MKNTTTGELRNPNIDLRARYAFRISLVLTASFVLGVASTVYLAITANTPQLFVFSAAGAVSVVMNLLALRSSRQRKVETAVYLIIATIILNIPLIPIFISGPGLLLGIVGFISIFMIATLTLVQPQTTLATIAGIILGVTTLLIEIFYPRERLDIEFLNVFALVVTLFSILLFGYYIYQQFANYPLRNKLILLFIVVVIFSVVSVAIVSNILIRGQITQLVGQSQQILAERLAFEIGKDLESQIENLLTAATQFEEIADESNKSYVGTNTDIENQIIALDQEWLTSSDQSNLIQEVLANQTADELREFQALFPAHVELFLTDAYGANLAATNRTSDYYQADEDWWKLAYNLGRGRIYISQPEFDESSQTYATLIAIPIYADNQVVGILRSTYEVTAILESLKQGTISDTKKVDLRTSNDMLLTGESLPTDEVSDLRTVMGAFGEIQYKGEASLVSQQRVFSSADSNAREAVSQLGWSVIVSEGVDDALQPVQQQTRAITMIALVVAVLVGILGFYASQLLASPILALTDITRQVSEGNLSIRADISTQDEIGGLARSFNQMTTQLRDTLGSLERRVAERTADVELARLLSERRAQELHAISEISRIISTEQRLNILLPLITRLVSERFDFYHVGIFFVDETRRFTYLQAANSEGGQRMLIRGHRLDVGKGLVGSVAQAGTPRIALDVGSDSSYFNNPDLPETRSEMALPLNIRGLTIGVLDVQSTKPGAFTESDASTLGILADQVAIAIENARLFGQTQQAREEAEALYAQILKQEWGSFIKQVPQVGYHHTPTGGMAISNPIFNDEIRQSLEKGQVVVLEGKGTRSTPSLAVPVKLRGQTLGVLNIKSPTSDRKWNQDEINLAQAISDRLALALDNARLLQESQRRAAKEAKIGEVSAKIGASINMQNVLQTAVEELGRALPGSEVVIQFGSNSDGRQDS